MQALIGAILSVMLAMTILFYAAQKFTVVAAQSNAFITAADHESFYSSNSTFGADQGLNMAVGVIGTGEAFQTPDGSLDWTYAEIHAVAYSWNPEDNDHVAIETHWCSEEELASTFMKIKEDDDPEWLDFLKSDFICIDTQEMNVYGNINSAHGRTI